MLEIQNLDEENRENEQLDLDGRRSKNPVFVILYVSDPSDGSDGEWGGRPGRYFH